jgi:hypothetical protein
MNLKPTREIGIDIFEKSQEFLMPVSSITVADGDTACHIHRRKQRHHWFVRFTGALCANQRSARLSSD